MLLRQHVLESSKSSNLRIRQNQPNFLNIDDKRDKIVIFYAKSC